MVRSDSRFGERDSTSRDETDERRHRGESQCDVEPFNRQTVGRGSRDGDGEHARAGAVRVSASTGPREGRTGTCGPRWFESWYIRVARAERGIFLYREGRYAAATTVRARMYPPDKRQ